MTPAAVGERKPGGRRSPLRNARGFTMVELVMVLIIAAIALPALMIYFSESMQHSAEAQIETMGLGLAQELMEEVKAKRWDEFSPIMRGSPLEFDPAGPYTPPLGFLEAGESRCNPVAVGCTPFDDIDDYNGLDNNPPEDPHGAPMSQFDAFRQIVTVCYVSEVAPVNDGGSGADAGACVAGPTDYKKIIATVQWGNGGQVQLQSVTANYQVEAPE